MPAIDPVFISNETGQVIIKDDGTAILDGTNMGAGVMIVVEGYIIKNPAYKQDQANTINAPGGVRGGSLNQ